MPGTSPPTPASRPSPDDQAPRSEASTTHKRGHRALKAALYLSAFASLCDPASRAYYDRKRSQGKRHSAALLCLARRRTDVLYAMNRDRQPYQPQHTRSPSNQPLAA